MPKGWKDVQSQAKRSRRIKLAVGVLILVVMLLIASWVARTAQSLFSPLKSVGQHRSYAWNGQLNINLLIRGNHISVLTYNPKEEKIIILNMPDELFLDVPFGFGKWQLRSVYELGQNQKEAGGNQLLQQTLTDFLAVPIDGFLDFSSLQPPKEASGIVEILRQNPFSGFNLLSSLKTDLTPWELLRLKIGLSSVRFDKVIVRDFLEIGVLDKETLPDGTKVLTADPAKLDQVLSDLADPTIVAEHKTIAVFNATDIPQLAGKYTRLITNLGGNVIITANAKEKFEKTMIQGEQSLTLKRLEQIFRLSDKISSVDENTISSRAQITVLVGEDRL